MNAALIGYVLIALAVINLIGLLLLFRRLAHVAVPAPQATPDTAAPSAEAAVAPAAPAPAPAAPVSPAIQPDQLAGMLRRLETRLGDIEDQVRRARTRPAPRPPGRHPARHRRNLRHLPHRSRTPPPPAFHPLSPNGRNRLWERACARHLLARRTSVTAITLQITLPKTQISSIPLDTG
jgi:hypothetical protein